MNSSYIIFILYLPLFSYKYFLIYFTHTHHLLTLAVSIRWSFWTVYFLGRNGYKKSIAFASISFMSSMCDGLTNFKLAHLVCL